MFVAVAVVAAAGDRWDHAERKNLHMAKNYNISSFSYLQFENNFFFKIPKREVLNFARNQLPAFSNLRLMRLR